MSLPIGALDDSILPPSGQGAGLAHYGVGRASSPLRHPKGLTADYFKWPGTLWNTEAGEQMEAAGSHPQTLSPLTRGVAWPRQPGAHNLISAGQMEHSPH